MPPSSSQTLALAGDVTHFALGLELLALPASDEAEGGGGEAGGGEAGGGEAGGMPPTGPLEAGEKGSDASAVDISDPAAAPAAPAEAEAAASGGAGDGAGAVGEAAGAREAAPEAEAIAEAEGGAAAAAEGADGAEGTAGAEPLSPPPSPPSPPPSPPSPPPPLPAATSEGDAARLPGELESVAVAWLACDCEGGDGGLSKRTQTRSLNRTPLNPTLSRHAEQANPRHDPNPLP